MWCNAATTANFKFQISNLNHYDPFHSFFHSFTTIVGAQAGELITEFTLAMRQRIGLKQILATLHIYPTLAEANKYAAGRWQQAHQPAALLRWVARYHTWRRR